MEFGLFFELSVPRPFADGIERLVYENSLEQVRLADWVSRVGCCAAATSSAGSLAGPLAVLGASPLSGPNIAVGFRCAR